MYLPRIMIAAPSSGSGKTLVTCGLLTALAERGIKAASFKCGPDYIDPMFHTKVIGVPSVNLDTFFTPGETVRYLFGRRAQNADISVMEGVMGLYDGADVSVTNASSWELADVTDTPVILVVNARGMSLSAAAIIEGFLNFRRDSHIKGIILNEVSASFYPLLKNKIEESLPVKVLGYVPHVEECVIESRHLGLVTPDEIEGLRRRLKKLAEVMEETIKIDEILRLASSASDIDVSVPESLRTFIAGSCKSDMAVTGNASRVFDDRAAAGTVSRIAADLAVKSDGEPLRIAAARDDASHGCEIASGFDSVRIAVARDDAFCFYYEDNLELLRQLGAEIVYFSPLRDKSLPGNVRGLLLGGGYPELYAKALSQNEPMISSVRSAIKSGMPFLAECGGYMYLHETMEDIRSQPYPMAGIFPGRVKKTDRLGRFGYVTLTANRAQIFGKAGCGIRAHEFHYFESPDDGDAFHAQKPYRNRSWECMHAGENFAAGFPHLYYYSNPEFAARFIDRCRG